MTDNKYVKEIALLGVDRRKINEDKLPIAIRAKLKASAHLKNQKQAGQPDAAKLLDIMTYHSYYSRRGTRPGKVNDYKLEQIDETKPYCEKLVMDVYAEIVRQDYHVRNDLLKSWIKKVEQRNKLVTTEKVLDLIDMGVALNKESRKAISNIIGLRGQQVLKFYKKDQYKVINLSDDIWIEGNGNERRAFYLKKRKENVSLANDLLMESWKSESQSEQLAFLKIMSVDLQVADFAFLERIYTSKYEGELINKKGLLSTKLMVCSMLARLDYAPLMSAVRSGLDDYIHQVRSSGLINTILSKKSNIIYLPQTQDDFWNGDYLNRLMGFDTKNMNIKLFDFDPYYWLNSFIGALPFSIWTELLGRSREEVVRYFLRDTAFQSKVSGQNIAIFQDSMIFNAIATNDRDLADAISNVAQDDDVNMLAPLMSQPAFERYVMNNRLRTELSLFEARSSEDIWSLSFSKNMVSELFDICKSGRFIPNVKFGRVMARYFHGEAFGYLAEVSKAQEGTQWYNAWLNNVLEPIRQSILIRQRINTL